MATRGVRENQAPKVALGAEHVRNRRVVLNREELRHCVPKTKPGGIIAGHDYSRGKRVKALCYGVLESVHEFCVENNWELSFLTVDPIESQSVAFTCISPMLNSPDV